MLLVIICFICSRFGISSANDLPKTVTEEWFTQKLDHFTPTNQETWKQRFYSNDQYYNATTGGPIFLFIGGEGEASVKWMTLGGWQDYAKRYGALIFQVEHRYYGKSHPTPDLSTENLKYLTIEQALADLANFIRSKQQIYPKAKWISLGGSYPGALSVWLRLKYPHLVYAAVSTSAPLHPQIDFKEYFAVVQDVLKQFGEDCFTATQQGMSELEELSNSEIDKLFNLCDSLDSVNSSKDISHLYQTISDFFATPVQYHRLNSLEIDGATTILVDELCEIMSNGEGRPVERLATVISKVLEPYQIPCLDYNYQKWVDVMANESWAGLAAAGGRQYTYQMCTEFGYFLSSNAEPQIFSDRFSDKFLIEQCTDIFGDFFDENFISSGVNRTNIIYGGYKVRDVKRAVFIHGSIDPWHALGITHSDNPEASVIYIQGTGHCADMYPSRNEDLDTLKAARRQVSDLIGVWLNQ